MKRLTLVMPLLVALLLGGSASADPSCGKGHQPPCPTPVPNSMGRLITSGLEVNDATAEGYTVVTGTPAIQSTIVRTGSQALKLAGTVSYAFTSAVGTGYYLRTYFYKTGGVLAAQNGILWFADTGNLVIGIVNETDGTLSLRYGGTAANGVGTTVVGSPASGLQDNTWYRLELYVKITSGATDEVTAVIDGVTFASATGLTITNTALGSFKIRYPTGAVDGYADDIALNDDSGTDQNTFPGPGKVVLLVPVSDNAGGTGWTLGTGTALGGNGFAAVDNEPPVGVADLAAGSDPKQIRNASANANVNYDANMTTYRNAGLSNYDVVKVITPIVATAAPVTTSAKLGTVGVASNPTITNVSLGAGGTAGAFWSGVAAGTYPTGWKWSFGTTTYNPAVTLTTNPVMRITQVTSSTRIAMVSFMGMYVDYEPHSPPSPIVHSEKMSMARSW